MQTVARQVFGARTARAGIPMISAGDVPQPGGSGPGLVFNKSPSRTKLASSAAGMS